MSKYVRAVNFVKNLVTGGSKTSPTMSSTTINVGNLKKNQDTLNKLKKTTDAYVTKAGSVDPSLKEALRKAGSKSLQKTDKILRKNKMNGGRIERKFGGGADMGKKLSAKQMKIASLAGNKKKIDGADFKKLQAMKKKKTPMEKAVKV